MRIYHILLLFFFISGVGAQNESTGVVDNIVPNPSFETYASPPIGWFYKGPHFTKVMRYWSAATAASPDVFGPRVRVPEHWAEKDFGIQAARSGVSMVGVTVYGCEEGKPHCREYIQIQLNESLIIGQNYYAEFWVSHLPRSLQINNLGMYFSKTRIERQTDDILTFTPQINADEVVDACDMQWVKLSGSFQAETEADYLIIGNFFQDSLTLVRPACSNALKFAYYYIEDVLVRKQEPILPVPERGDDISRVKLEPGKVIQLKNIFFETDKANLLPRSSVELNKLLQLMEKHPNMRIQINGHTDIRGDDEYNMDLSVRRSKAVVDFLLEAGVDNNRLKFEGFGSKLPVATNNTDEGRQLNRRVEFVVIKI